MQYFFSMTDKKGYVHSLDNLVIEYVTAGSDGAVRQILTDIQELGKKYEGKINYWERLNCKPCSKWSWCQHTVHLDDGIYLSIGHYVNYAKPKINWEVYPALKLEVNPNKHAGKEVLKDLLELLGHWAHDVTLLKYDYAVDIPAAPEDVEVFGTRKERGLYKGTRYYGQRNKNGYCKIYDKAKEQGLDSPMTRVEHTLVCSGKKATKNPSFEKVYVKSESKESDEKLTTNDKVLLEFCNVCSANGIEYESIIDKLDKRKKRFIKEQLKENEYEKLEYSEFIRSCLLEKVLNYFGAKEKEEKEDIEVDENGFVVVNENELPFD